MRDRILSLVLTAISRGLLRRDRLSGRMKHAVDVFAFDKERFVLPSGDRRLSAVYVSAGSDAPAVLICHGIGELVEYWGKVQGMLQEMGISSLVFNYSGYGASSGAVTAANCEEDVIAAYRALVDRGHRSIVLLGFSLGSGISLCGGFADRCGRVDFVRRIFDVSGGSKGDWLPGVDDACCSGDVGHGGSGS